MKLLRLLV